MKAKILSTIIAFVLIGFSVTLSQNTKTEIQSFWDKTMFDLSTAIGNYETTNFEKVASFPVYFNHNGKTEEVTKQSYKKQFDDMFSHHKMEILEAEDNSIKFIKANDSYRKMNIRPGSTILQFEVSASYSDNEILTLEFIKESGMYKLFQVTKGQNSTNSLSDSDKKQKEGESYADFFKKLNSEMNTDGDKQNQTSISINSYWQKFQILAKNMDKSLAKDLVQFPVVMEDGDTPEKVSIDKFLKILKEWKNNILETQIGNETLNEATANDMDRGLTEGQKYYIIGFEDWGNEPLTVEFSIGIVDNQLKLFNIYIVYM